MIAGILSRPTARQRRATIDLRYSSEALKRDLGLDIILYRDRRW